MRRRTARAQQRISGYAAKRPNAECRVNGRVWHTGESKRRKEGEGGLTEWRGRGGHRRGYPSLERAEGGEREICRVTGSTRKAGTSKPGCGARMPSPTDEMTRGSVLNLQFPHSLPVNKGHRRGAGVSARLSVGGPNKA